MKNWTCAAVFSLFLTVPTGISADIGQSSLYQLDDLFLQVESVEGERERKLLEKISVLMKQYHGYAKERNIEAIEELYFTEDGSREHLLRKYGRLGKRIFKPSDKFDGVKVEGPVYRWGQYYFPHIWFYPTKSERAHDLQFFYCKEQCLLASPLWANIKKYTARKNGIAARILSQLHTDDEDEWERFSPDNYEPELEFSSCIYPLYGKRSSPVCGGLHIQAPPLDGEQDKSAALEAFKRLSSAMADKNHDADAVLKEYFVKEEHEDYIVYKSGFLRSSKTPEDNSDYLHRLTARAFLKQVIAPAEEDIMGVARYKDLAFVFFRTTFRGESGVQFLPYSIPDEKFRDGFGLNLGHLLLKVYSFGKLLQTKMPDE